MQFYIYILHINNKYLLKKVIVTGNKSNKQSFICERSCVDSSMERKNTQEACIKYKK